MKRLAYEAMTMRENVDSLKNLKVGDIVDIYTSTSQSSSYRAEITQQSYEEWLGEMKEDPYRFCRNHTTEVELVVDVVESWDSHLDAFVPYDRTRVIWRLTKIRSRIPLGPRYGLTRFLNAYTP